MADFPYHVAGGSFTPSCQPLQLLESMMNVAPAITHEAQALSRRRKLWEVPHKFHCPVIGTCFDVAELRGLMKKVMHFPADTTDFVLHTTAVGCCEVRSKLAELLQKQLEKARQENEALRQEKSTETQALSQRIIDLRAELAGRDATIANQTGQLDQLRSSLPDLKDRQSLLRRASDSEARCTALTAEAERHESEIWHLRQRMRHAEQTINQLLAEDASDEARDTGEASSPNKLSGKCVLCVGGRTGAIDAYRQVVEQSGGRFMHHDGGLEESLHRIDSALSAADVVICQAGCISHNAYWRVKEQCRRTGKPCLFVRNAGISSFGRVISQACAIE